VSISTDVDRELEDEHRMGEKSQELFSELKSRHRKKHWQCLLISLICFIISAVAFVFQILGLHNILFCHKEALGHLYIPVLIVLSFSSIIAILGVILAQITILRGKELPPYATALGTPVLVISSTAHLAYGGRQQKKGRKTGEQLALHSRTYEASRQSFCWPYAYNYSSASMANDGSAVELVGSPVLQNYTQGATPIADRVIGQIIQLSSGGFQIKFYYPHREDVSTLQASQNAPETDAKP
jgi:hypothetical protein